jgi:hypothetical protein
MADEDERPDPEGELNTQLQTLKCEPGRQIDIEGFLRQRARALDLFLKSRRGKDTRRSSVLSVGSAIIAADNQQGWQTLRLIEDRRQYAELRYWAPLYFCDLHIAHLHAGRKIHRVEKNPRATTQNIIFAGMMEADGAWVHEQMGKARPSPRGYMVPEDPPAGSDLADRDEGTGK